MDILVTGGAGYLGSVLVPLLLADGHRVVVLDNFMYGQTPLLDCCHDERLTIVNGDVRDERLLADLVPAADVLLPLACLTGAPISARDPWTARAVNLEAVRHIVRLKAPGQMLVFPSTNSGYGIGQADIHCDEDTPLRPVSLYGRLKVEAEAIVLEPGDAISFRFATLFGTSPRMRLDLLVNDFVFRAVRDRSIVLFEPDFTRNYLHVRDAGRAFVHALANYGQMAGRPYNVGLSDANLSKRELCDVIRRHVGDFHVHVGDLGKDPDQRNYIVSNARIEATGFRPAYSLDQGIAELVKGCRIIGRLSFGNA
jgi:nucleoside-diphosphate-sugar epimerase